MTELLHKYLKLLKRSKIKFIEKLLISEDFSAHDLRW